MYVVVVCLLAFVCSWVVTNVVVLGFQVVAMAIKPRLFSLRVDSCNNLSLRWSHAQLKAGSHYHHVLAAVLEFTTIAPLDERRVCRW